MATTRVLAQWAICSSLLMGAPQQNRLTFDVASVKPAALPVGITIDGDAMTASRGVAIPRESGGPGSSDPGRIHYPLISLKSLLRRAYDSYYEIVGPRWLDTQIIQVDATMPPDTTREQFQEMLRNLMVDRLKLTFHAGTKEVQGFALAVAKNGPKLKEAAATAPTAAGPTNGFQGARGGRVRAFGQQQTMKQLAEQLKFVLRSPVADETGLNGTYDYTLTYAGGFGPTGPFVSQEPAPTVPGEEPISDIFSAMQAQLGLRLQPKKVPEPILVIDHIEKTPTAN